MNRMQVQRGLSLIELMIGLLLATILLLGVLQIFDGNRRTHQLQQAFSRVQESGRIATDMLARELRNAAFDGCVVNLGFLDNRSGDPLFDGEFFIGDDDDVDDVDPGVELGDNDREVLAGTDVLRLRGAADACAGSGRMTGANGNTVDLAGNCAIDGGEYVMVANCQEGDIVRAVGDASGSQLTVNNNLLGSYDSEARIYRIYVREYFVSADTASGQPGLFVTENGGAARELVPGVEDMQLQYGRDTAGNNDIVDIWGDAPANKDESLEVAAVRVQLVVAAEGATDAGSFAYTRLGEAGETEVEDGRLRKEFSVYTKLRNRGAR